MAQSTNLGLHWTILKSWFIYIFILWNSPQMVSSGMVYYWVYHIRNFVLRNFCHLSSSHGPGLVTRPICTSRVWSMLVTAWPWHVGTSMWLTKSAAPMVTRKCWLYLLVKRNVIVVGCNLQFQTSGRDLLWFEMFRRPSILKQFCISNYISMRQINTSIYFTVSQCLSHSAALLDQDGFESKTSNTSCIMYAMPSGIRHIMPHHATSLRKFWRSLRPIWTHATLDWSKSSTQRHRPDSASRAWHSQINWLVKTSLKEKMDVE